MSDDHRRAGLARTLIEMVEHEAVELGKREILCTIHPKNEPSKTLFKSLGYRCIGSTTTAYGRRDVYGRDLPDDTKRWYR